MAKKKTTEPVVEIDKPAPAPEAFVVAYKGFDKNMQCRGYQFEVGKSYTHDGPVKSCESGFHACKHPLSVFQFYPPAGSRFAEVRMSGDINDRESADTKIAAARISIGIELSIPDLVKRAWDYVWGKCTIEGPVATGNYGAASATGYEGQRQRRAMRVGRARTKDLQSSSLNAMTITKSSAFLPELLVKARSSLTPSTCSRAEPRLR